MNPVSKSIFVDNLSVRVLFMIVLSWLWNLVKDGRSRLQVYYFEVSQYGAACARCLCRVAPIDIIDADYSWVEIRNADDEFSHWRLLAHDAIRLCRSVRVEEIEGNSFLTRLSQRFDRDRLILYVVKCVNEEIKWQLFRINVIEWFRRHDGLDQTDPLLYYCARSRWSEYLAKYGADHGISIRWYRSFPSWLTTCQGWARLVLGGVRYQLKWFVRARESGLETIGSVNTALRNNSHQWVGCDPTLSQLQNQRN